MTGKIVSAMVIAILLTSVPALVFKIQSVRADGGTIYIRADGSIDPTTAPIQRNGDTYTFTGNVSSVGDGIIVQRDNMTLDVAGYLISGVGNGVGVDLTGRSNVTLINGNIRDFNDAVHLSNSQANVIMGNNVDNVHGLFFSGSNNNNVSSNNVTSSSNNLAFYFSSSSCNTIIANNVTNSSQAFRFETGSSNNTLYRNTLFGGATIGIQFIGGENNAAIENSVTSYQDGIEIIGGAHNSLVSRNTVSGSGGRGIDVWGGGYDNSIVGNNVTNCWYGIRCSYYGNTLFGNELENNGIGIGLELSSSSGNIATENRLLNNYYGIEFYQTNNSVCNGNDIMNSHYEGISVFQSYNNSIFHNSIVNNTEQVHGSSASSNLWDDGYPSGGNYWSDYEGTDIFCGPYQNETGSDGIGDTPYVVDSNNIDHFPFTSPWALPDVAVSNVVTSKTGCLPAPTVNQNYTTFINTTVTNQVNYSLTFNVTVYANETSVTSQSMTLPPSGSEMLTFVWNTTGYAKGNYTILGCVAQISGEIDVADNNFTGGWIVVTMIGDITGPDGCPDGKVDMRDVGNVASLFCVFYPDPRYNPNFDINDDGKIDMRDIGTVASHFGQVDP